MDSGTKLALLVTLLIAAIGLAACVVKTAPAHRHRVQTVEHEKHKPAKHKKMKKHKKH
jgi:hypothetical protein